MADRLRRGTKARRHERREGVGEGRDRPVRRADAAESGEGPGRSRRSDHRHERRRYIDAAGDREQFRDLLQEARPETARQRHRPKRRRRAEDREGSRLSRSGPSQLRARRAGDGDRLRRRAAQLLHDARGRSFHDRAMRRSWSTSSSTTRRKWMSIAWRTSIGTGKGRSIIIGVMEHIEEAGIHSGDSRLCLAAVFVIARTSSRS